MMASVANNISEKNIKEAWKHFSFSSIFKELLDVIKKGHAENSVYHL